MSPERPSHLPCQELPGLGRRDAAQRRRAVARGGRRASRPTTSGACPPDRWRRWCSPRARSTGRLHARYFVAHALRSRARPWIMSPPASLAGPTIPCPMKTGLSLSLAALLVGARARPRGLLDRAGARRTAARRPAPSACGMPATAPIDKALEDRILALDPEHVTDRDVRETLARGPTPRIMLLHGGIYPVHLLMESFAEFLLGDGLPDRPHPRPRRRRRCRTAPTRAPRSRPASSPGTTSSDGVRPMLVGHSQGGIQAVKVLHELAGALRRSTCASVNPLTGVVEARTTIVDPLTGRRAAGGRPVGRLRVGRRHRRLVAGAARPVERARRTLRTIPDTVDEFTGYRIGVDLFAWDVPGLEGCEDLHAERQGERPQRDAARVVLARLRARDRAPRRGPGDARVDRRLRPPDAGQLDAAARARPPTTCCGRPTSGTASRSTGRWRRSG